MKRLLARTGTAMLVISLAVTSAPGMGQARSAEAVTAEDFAKVTNTIGGIGKGSRTDIFSGMFVDSAAGSIRLHVTDVAAGRAMVARGLSALTAQARSKVSVEVVRSRYSLDQMSTGSRALWKVAGSWKKAGAEIYSIVLKSDGSGLEVRTSKPERAEELGAGLTRQGVDRADIRYVPGEPVVELSRENPQEPYEGGVPIRDIFFVSGWTCTNAFGIRIGSTTYTVTAKHCVDLNEMFTDMNGDVIGRVAGTNGNNDVARVRANANSEVWVNDTYVQNYRHYNWSYNGQYVCHSGYSSRPNRCAILVTNDTTEWMGSDGYTRIGSEGSQCGTCRTVTRGDSGGPVWTTGFDGYLESRGVISVGWGQVSSNPTSYHHIMWTETPRILSVFGADLIGS